MVRKRNTTCANEQCRRICIPRARGLCDPCLAAYRARHDRARIGKRETSHYDNAWRKQSRREISAHIHTHGYICTNDCGTAHPETNPLTLDHVKARSLDEGTRVLCRRCNATKGSKHG